MVEAVEDIMLVVEVVEVFLKLLVNNKVSEVIQ